MTVAVATEFHMVCDLDEVWEGEVAEFEVAGHDVLIVHRAGGEVVALQALCPHQDISLAEGGFENGVLTCRAHLWQFDSATGAGLNPTDCRLARYPLRVVDGKVQISVEGVVPFRVGA
ncbi:Rieske 2Fe-2S domain-containing protein [Zavarzinia compransoris]|uniref:Rieske 2Fe-2S domain-containing protein n=1 Tax=Zavarzinia marina TaxID=2911065 RepID=UPI001F26E011|nr:Rieske 2Fe-2S domain-containing protein [Zavarzinia marina]MCF4167018.1 Rieske 2Fe-2S domain-containing protein [Zavarzinia marina]